MRNEKIAGPGPKVVDGSDEALLRRSWFMKCFFEPWMNIDRCKNTNIISAVEIKSACG